MTPAEVSVSTTIEPLSELVTKKLVVSRMARPEDMVTKGYFSNNLNMAVATFSFTAAVILWSPSSSKYSALPPKILIHKKVNSDGTKTTPKINSVMVRPFDTRAMNIPTNGDHAIHQA